MADDIPLNVRTPKKGKSLALSSMGECPEKNIQINGVDSSKDAKSSFIDHVTPDNLSRKLLLHKKTELSDFFQAKQGIANNLVYFQIMSKYIMN